jgi:photosystem II stability/assembly factor-like uncharacterized protein
LQPNHSGTSEESRPVNRQGRRTFTAALGALGSLSLLKTVSALGEPLPAARPVVWSLGRSTQVDRVAFMALAHRDSLWLAVGERGVVARSSDYGARWQVTRTDLGRTLTCLSLHATFCIAAGHSGVVYQADAQGTRWERLTSPSLDRVNPSRDPWLTCFIDPAGRTFLAGAFGRMAVSEDRGQTWRALEPLGPDFDRHIYGLAFDEPQRRFLLCGESGTLAESHDGQSYRATSAAGYQGSLFGLLVNKEIGRLAVGMRGRVFRQSRSNRPWQALDLPTTVAWQSATSLSDGRIVLLGDQGMVAISEDLGYRFRLEKAATAGLSGAVQAPTGEVWLSGRSGIRPWL